MNPFNDRKRRAEIVFGQPMGPCPKCGSYHMTCQTPIKLDITLTDSPRKIISKWARETRVTGGILEGPVYIMCRDCGHKGPSVDCSGRTSTDVYQDPAVAKEMKRLWNTQK